MTPSTAAHPEASAAVLGYAGVYSGCLPHARRGGERSGVILALLSELGRRQVVGGQVGADTVINVADEKARSCEARP